MKEAFDLVLDAPGATAWSLQVIADFVQSNMT